MRPQRGLTLIELLTVIVVLALVAAIGVPGLRDVVLNNRQTAAMNELVTALQLARSEAITRNTAAPAGVSVCASADGLACGGTWSDGWIVFTDADVADGATVDTLLRAAEAPQGLDITTGVGTVSYRRDGRVVGATDFVFCDGRGDSSARVIQVGISGRPSASKYLADGSGPNCGG